MGMSSLGTSNPLFILVDIIRGTAVDQKIAGKNINRFWPEAGITET